MIKRIIFLVFCALTMTEVRAHAQFFLEQAKVNLDVSAGEHHTGSLLIHNTSADSEFIRVYWEDFEYTSPYDGTKKFLPAGTAPNSVSQWVAFNPQTFTIPPYGQQTINYTVTVPSQFNEGHYGVLFFEKTAMATINSDSVNLVTRIGCLFFIEPANKSKKADLQNVELKGHIVTADFVNQGNVIIIPHTTYYVMQQGGLVLNRGDIKKLYVPPGVSAALEIPLKNQLNPGSYSLVVNSDLEDGDVVVKEIGLNVDASGQISITSSQG